MCIRDSRCYDADFEDLGDQFEYSFKNGVLTIRAQFAERISGLTIDDSAHDTIYRLRYLDSPQFAWLADTLWMDYGVMTMGDEALYYSDAERQAQAERERAEREQTRNTFALLEGTWISEDGLQKYVFSMDADGDGLRAEELWRSEETEQTLSLIHIYRRGIRADVQLLGSADPDAGRRYLPAHCGHQGREALQELGRLQGLHRLGHRGRSLCDPRHRDEPRQRRFV